MWKTDANIHPNILYGMNWFKKCYDNRTPDGEVPRTPSPWTYSVSRALKPVHNWPMKACRFSHPKRAGWQDAHPKEHRNQCKWRRRWVVAAQGLFSQAKDFGFCSKCEEKSRKTAGKCHETPFVLIILPAILNKNVWVYLHIHKVYSNRWVYI